MSQADIDPPSVPLSGSQLDALELIVTGLVHPIDGYRLPGESIDGWPCGSTLVVASSTGELAVAAGTLILTDPDRTPLAVLTVAGALDNADGTHFLAGAVVALRPPEHGPARSLRVSQTDDFSGSFVSVFEDPPTPAAISGAVRAAGMLPIVFLAVAAPLLQSARDIQRMIDTLRSCADETDRAVVKVAVVAPLAEGVTTESVVALVLENTKANTVQRVGTSPAVAAGESHAGTVVLLTGLSGSGKSTIGRALSERLTLGGERTVILDGDDVRTNLSDDLTFSALDREKNLRRIGWVASKISQVGGVAICAPIAPFESARREIRRMAEQTGRFILVYVSTPLEVCEARDRKGLYARARRGEISDFTGINSPFEEPEDADVTINTAQFSVEEAVDLILARAFATGPAAD